MYKRQPLTFLPGYLRGLTFHGKYAIVGSSKSRENRTFQGLDLDQRLKDKDVEARCGFFIVDLTNGNVVEWLRVEGFVNELYDVVALPGVRRPMAVGIKGNEIERILCLPPELDS